jgi:pyruvate-formate lyase-activating enzyme
MFEHAGNGPQHSPEDTPAYGFGGRLSRAFPSQVIIDVTERCNLACIHCPHPAFRKSVHYGGRSLDPELNAKAIDEVATAGRGIVRQVRYTSEGEPLLNPALFGMLDKAVRRSGTFVSLTTNGTLLTAERVERLLATGLNLVDVSLDALTPDTYATIRVNGRLDTTRAGVLRLIAAAREAGVSTRIVVSYIEQPANAHETADFERFWREAGAHDVVIRRQHSASGAITTVADELRTKAASRTRRPCVFPWERIVLKPRGVLSFCPADWTHGSSLADYRETTIAALWQGREYDALRQAHLTNVYGGHPFCEQCPDWQETRWPDEGPSYATLVERLRVNT